MKRIYLEIVLYDGTGLVRLSVKARAITTRFRHAIRDFVPNYRRETIQAKASAPNLNVGVQRHHAMAPIPLTRNANVSDNTTNAPTFDENPHALPPYPVQFLQKQFIFNNFAKLTTTFLVFLKCPIRRRGHHQVNGIILNP